MQQLFHAKLLICFDIILETELFARDAISKAYARLC